MDGENLTRPYYMKSYRESWLLREGESVFSKEQALVLLAQDQVSVMMLTECL